jgi:hypothetical protein
MAQEDVEQSDFPLLCETCLGPSPYLKMIKVRCVICSGIADEIHCFSATFWSET